MDADLRLRRRQAAELVVDAMSAWCRRELVWGFDDCMLAVADVVRQVTGKDPARRFRDRYKTRRGAVRALGRGGIVKAARDSARALHWRRINPADAQPGDVGLVEIKRVVYPGARALEVDKKAGRLVRARGRTITSHAAMICRAPGWFVGRNDRGVTALPASQIAMAWSIL